MKYILLIFLTTITSIGGKANSIINIWSGTHLENEDVTLEIYLPDNSRSPTTAIIVCPGGSYCWLDYETEGKGVAEWLQNQGIAAFVLKYRVSGIWAHISHSRLFTRGNQYPDMITDVQRAIQVVRDNAIEYSINPHKLGVMGFSAGGHLAMMSGLFFDTNFVELSRVECNVVLRPDFVVPIYPVVTMADKEFTHKRSRRGALGEYRKFNKLMRDSLSLEKKIVNNTPPVFLVNCKDDPIVKYQNSELLDSALTTKNIPHKYIQYKTGGHGFGADAEKATAESILWKNEFINWLNSIDKL